MRRNRNNKKAPKAFKRSSRSSASASAEPSFCTYEYPSLLRTDDESFNIQAVSYFDEIGASWDVIYDCTQFCSENYNRILWKTICSLDLSLNLLCRNIEPIRLLNIQNANIYYLFQDVSNIEEIRWIIGRSPDLMVYPILDCHTPPDFLAEFSENPFNDCSDRVIFVLGKNYQPTHWPTWLTEIAVGFTTQCGEVPVLEGLPVHTLVFLNPAHTDWPQRIYPTLSAQIQLAVLPPFLRAYSGSLGEVARHPSCLEEMINHLPENIILQPFALCTEQMALSGSDHIERSMGSFMATKKMIAVPREIVRQKDVALYWIALLETGCILANLTSRQRCQVPQKVQSVTLASVTHTSMISMLNEKRILQMTCWPNLPLCAQDLQVLPTTLDLYLPQKRKIFERWYALRSHIKRLTIYLEAGNTKEDLDACLAGLKLRQGGEIKLRIKSPEVNPEVLKVFEAYDFSENIFTGIIFQYPEVELPHLRAVPANMKVISFVGWKKDAEAKMEILRDRKSMYFVPRDSEDLAAYLEDLPRTQFLTVLEFLSSFSGQIHIPEAAIPFILLVRYNNRSAELTALLERQIPKKIFVLPNDAASEEVEAAIDQYRKTYSRRSEVEMPHSDCMEFESIFSSDQSQIIKFLIENPHYSIRIKNDDLFYHTPEEIRRVIALISLTSRIRPRRFILDSNLVLCISIIRPHNELCFISYINTQAIDALDPDHVIVITDLPYDLEALKQLPSQKFFFRVETTHGELLQFVDAYARGMIVHPYDPVDFSQFTRVEIFEFVFLTVAQAKSLPRTARQVRLHAVETEALECLPRHLEIVLLGNFELAQLQHFSKISICLETPKEMLYSLDVPVVRIFSGAEKMLSLLPRRSTRVVHYEGAVEDLQTVVLCQPHPAQLFVVLASLENINAARISNLSFKLAVQSLPSETAIPDNVYWYPGENFLGDTSELLPYFPRRLLLDDTFLSGQNPRIMANLQEAEELFLNFSCKELLQAFISGASGGEAEIRLVISYQTFDLWLDHFEALLTLMQKFPKAHITSEALRDEAIYGRYLRLCARNTQALSAWDRPGFEFPDRLSSFLNNLPFRDRWRTFSGSYQIKIWEGFQCLTSDQQGQIINSGESIKQQVETWLLTGVHDARALRALWQDLFPNVSGSGVVELASEDEQPKGEEPVYHWRVESEVISSQSAGVYCVENQYFMIAESVNFSVGAELTQEHFFRDALGHQRMARAQGQSGIKFFEGRREQYPACCEVTAGQEGETHQVVELKPQNGVQHRWRLFSSVCYIEQGKRLYVLDTLQQKPQ